MRYFLAIDIGASSGRHILGRKEDGEIKTEEVYRFANGMDRVDDRLVWDMERLEREVKAGLKAAFAKEPAIESLSIDTWGVDYVLLRGEEPVWPCHAYRDGRTEAVIGEVHKAVPFAELYAHTGIQFQPFNTVYQLYADKLAGRLEGVTDFLMAPEYLLWRLTGVKAHEYTNATTTGLVNAQTGEYDRELVEKLGLPQALFRPLAQPGTVLGPLLRSVAEEVGGNCRAVLCATHDTASAVEGIPMEGNAPFISSGTWSLLGAKLPRPLTTEEGRRANFTNEGGVGYIRYLKNIMGMWLINRLRSELCPDVPFPEIVKAAEESTCAALVDANADVFMAPESMKAAFDAATGGALETVGDYFRCAYRSLAACYAAAVGELEAITGECWGELYIVGGGAKNQYLNRLTAEHTGKKVIALPIEATALGNIKIQMEAGSPEDCKKSENLKEVN